MYIYIEVEGDTPDEETGFAVGFFVPIATGHEKFEVESMHSTRDLAAERVNYLNGGSTPDAIAVLNCELVNEILKKFMPFIDEVASRATETFGFNGGKDVEY